MCMEIKCQRIIPKDPYIKNLSEKHAIKIYAVSRQSIEENGMKCVVAFSSPSKRSVFLIEEDCDQMSEISVYCVIIHEMAHIVYDGTTDEEKCDETALFLYGKDALDLARAETEVIINKLRSNRRKVS